MTVERYPEQHLAISGYNLSSVTTVTKGLYQLPRSDEEKRTIEKTEEEPGITNLTASGFFPPLTLEADSEYFNAQFGGHEPE